MCLYAHLRVRVCVCVVSGWVGVHVCVLACKRERHRQKEREGECVCESARCCLSIKDDKWSGETPLKVEKGSRGRIQSLSLSFCPLVLLNQRKFCNYKVWGNCLITQRSQEVRDFITHIHSLSHTRMQEHTHEHTHKQPHHTYVTINVCMSRCGDKI